jgi:hypothetical protein
MAWVCCVLEIQHQQLTNEIGRECVNHGKVSDLPGVNDNPFGWTISRGQTVCFTSQPKQALSVYTLNSRKKILKILSKALYKI